MNKKLMAWPIKITAFCAIAYIVLDMLGNLLLMRTDETVERGRTPADLVKVPVDARWNEVLQLMQVTSPQGERLTYAELERAKQLVWVGLTAHPDEWEGNDLVLTSLRTIQYLTLAYPGLSEHVITQEDLISLGKVYEHVSANPVARWKVPFVELLGRTK